LPPTERCQQEFPDDPAIKDNVQMLRRIPPWHVVPDENKPKGRRPSSAAFEDDKDGAPMSVYRRDLLDATGGTVQRVMVGHEGYALVGLYALQLRSRDQTIHSDPLPKEAAHAVVCGPKTDSNRRFFARQAFWVIEPPAVESGTN